MPATLTAIGSQGARLTRPLTEWLTPADRDGVREEANRWIKRLRTADYDGTPMRDRFTYRGDSLWWFTEIYLHKMRRLERAIATLIALEHACQAESPAALELSSADPVAREASAAFARKRGVRVDLPGAPGRLPGRRWSSYLIGLTARLSRLAPSRRESSRRRAEVAAFIHTAFWRRSPGDDGPRQEAYVGRILEAVAERLPAGAVQYVGVGPRRNFRARRWWDPLAPATGDRPLVVPIEQLAPRRALAESLSLWDRRDDLAREVVGSAGIRAAAEVRGYDLWPVLRPELVHTALLQWPWSARAMDEAGAALDRLSPDVVLTYAEAGGWGRALVLEARRRGVPSVGVQHGFIYRHWLNYLHEPDELLDDGRTGGFPLPDRTLVFDQFAAEHLAHASRFPAEAVRVTGSPGLADLSARLAALGAGERAAIRADLGAGPGDRLAILVAKFSEIREHLPPLFAAVAARPAVRLVVKPHPAETPAVYARAAAGCPGVSVAPVDTDLARLLAVADTLVTMNSTVAIDGLALDVPALVVGAPTNLAPFVEAGVMIGASDADVGAALETVLYDAKARAALSARAQAFIARYGMRADRRAASRAADEILALARRTDDAAANG